MAVLRPQSRPSVQHLAGAPDGERELLERVMADVLQFEGGIGQDFRENCLKYYRQFRGFRQFRDVWTKTSPNDKDDLLSDTKKTWGAHLHIPLSFRTIETLVPRAVAHRPRLLYLPRDENSEENVANVRMMIDGQQDNIDIDLPFQAVMRAGRIYGLGVGKTYWRTDYASRRRVNRRMFIPSKFYVGDLERTKAFDDPYFEDVDVFDFMWDGFGHDTRSCDWMVHRTWLSLPKCLDRIAAGVWNTESAKLLDEDKLRSMADGTKYDEIFMDRMTASGFSSFNFAMRGEQPHEVLEWNNGEQVFTVLDRQAVVQEAENQCVGHMPFQVYRPTPLQKQMVGIGDLEPLNHLQRELDTLRSQRRDAATLALAAGIVYDEGSIDEEDLVFGPHLAIPARNSRPQDAIMQLQVKDVPGSSWQDEQVIKQDMDGVVGLSDAMNPQEGQASTATEAQLVQASLSARIQLGSRRFEIEVVRAVAKAFLYLDQRMIVSERAPIRQPADGYDLIEAAQAGRWQWFPQGPGAIRGEFEIIPEGGSMAARNIPQDRQDAQMFLSLTQNPFVEPRRPLLKALELMGIRDPEAWLKQSEAPVPPKALALLAQAGVDQRLIQQAVVNAQHSDPQLAQQGPGVPQVDAMMNGNGGPPA